MDGRPRARPRARVQAARPKITHVYREIIECGIARRQASRRFGPERGDSLAQICVGKRTGRGWLGNRAASGTAITTINKQASTFSFAGVSTTLASPDKDDTSGSKAYTFNPVVVPTSILDGSYSPSVRIVGTDINGMAVNQLIPVTDVIVIDRTAPLIDPTISVPPSNVQGEPPAAGNGRQTTFGGIR